MLPRSTTVFHSALPETKEGDDRLCQAKPITTPTPDPSQQPPRSLPLAGVPAGGGERADRVEGQQAPARVLTPLTQQARALYEGGVVPVRELARLCGVSTRTLYYHVHKHGWRRRRSRCRARE